MRLEKNLKNMKEHDNVALEADLVCDCGNDYFDISHSGKLKKGLFGGLTLSKQNKQIVIKAKCPTCSKVYTVYDSTKDGVKAKEAMISDFDSLTLKDGTHLFQVHLMYNYYEENFKTDKFEMILIDVKSKDGKKTRLFED